MGDIVKMYREHGRQIVPHRIKARRAIWRMFVGGSYGARKGDKVLREALTGVLKEDDHVGRYASGASRFPCPAILIAAIAPGSSEDACERVRDDRYKLVLCMASTPPPIFRSLARSTIPTTTTVGSSGFACRRPLANNPIDGGRLSALLVRLKCSTPSR